MSTGDPELDAMAAVSVALSPLNDDERGRVLRWASERFDVKVRRDEQPADPGDPAPAARQEEGDASTGKAFDTFGELFAAAGPTTDADKVIVAAYWTQVVEGNTEWLSGGLNKNLRDLGHVVGHLSQKLAAHIAVRPQRLIQLRKSGSSKQARKTYKMTDEGIKYVGNMLKAKDA